MGSRPIRVRKKGQKEGPGGGGGQRYEMENIGRAAGGPLTGERGVICDKNSQGG